MNNRASYVSTRLAINARRLRIKRLEAEACRLASKEPMTEHAEADVAKVREEIAHLNRLNEEQRGPSWSRRRGGGEPLW